MTYSIHETVTLTVRFTVPYIEPNNRPSRCYRQKKEVVKGGI